MYKDLYWVCNSEANRQSFCLLTVITRNQTFQKEKSDKIFVQYFYQSVQAAVNKIPQTVQLINRNSSPLSEPWKSTIMVPACWVRTLFQVMVFSLCLLVREEGREIYGVSFRRTLIPFMGVLPSWPSDVPKATPITTTFRGQDLTCEVLGDKKHSDPHHGKEI